MDNKFDLFKQDFLRIKEMGFLPSHRSHNTGIGKTYEDLLGVVENNLKEPDLYGFEVKSQRSYTGSYVTLFTKSPTAPIDANSFLRDNFGAIDNKLPYKILHTSIFHGTYNTYKSGYRFSLEVNRTERRLYLLVKDFSNNLLSSNVFWSFDDLEICLKRKLNRLAFISAITRLNNEIEEFYFNKATIFSDLKPFGIFLYLLEQRKIMVDIRIGYYKSGTNLGKPHDHGSGFRIKKENLVQLYEKNITL